MLATFLNDVRDGDVIVPRRLAGRLHVHLNHLSRMARVNRNVMSSKPESRKVQDGLGEIARIIARASELSGDEAKAIFWFRHQHLSSLGGTAAEIVEQGYGRLVLEELDRIEAGVYS